MSKTIVKKEAANEQPVKKKKRSCCCSCLIAFMIVSIVLLAAIFGVGWYFGDKYSKEFLGMPLTDSLGVLQSLYGAKEKNVVDNPYGEEDLDAFYSTLKTQLLLKDEVDMDLGEILDLVAPDTQTSALISRNARSSAIASADETWNTDGTGGSDNADGTDGAGGSSNVLMDSLIDYIATKFTRANIDGEKITTYLNSTAGVDEYVLSITDKSLAAFVNEFLNVGIEYIGKMDMGEDSPLAMIKEFDIDISKTIMIKQVTINERAVVDADGNESTAATMGLTIWVGLEDTVDKIASKYIEESGYGWAKGVASMAIKSLLPKNLYFTAEVGLNKSVTPEIYLNGMKGASRENAYKLINAVMDLSGNGSDIQATVKTALDAALESTLYANADAVADFSEAAQGKVTIDVFKFLIDAMKINEGAEGADVVTKRDLFELLNLVLVSTPDSKLNELRPYMFDNWYEDAEGNFAYDPVDKSGYTKVNFEEEFMKSLGESYALAVTDENGDTKDIDGFLAALGLNFGGSGGSLDTNAILNLLDPVALNNMLNNPNELTLNITDHMLGAILEPRISTLTGGSDGSDGSSTSDMLKNVKLVAVAILPSESDDTRVHLQVAVELNVAKLFESLSASGDLGGVQKIVSNILPEKFVVTANVDISTVPNADGTYDQTNITINDYNDVSKILSVLDNMAGLELTSMFDSVSDTIRDAIHEITKLMPVAFVTSQGTFDNPGALVLPDIFSTIVDYTLKDEYGNRIVEPEQLKNLLAQVNNTSAFDDMSQIETDGAEAALIDEMTHNYYINTSGTPLNTFSDLTTFLSSGFTANTINIAPSDIGLLTTENANNYLAYDARTSADLGVTITEAALASVITDQLPVDMAGFSLYSVDTVKETQSISLVFKVALNGLMQGMENMLIVDAIYATATINMSSVLTNEQGESYYDTSFKINSMSDEDIMTLQTVLSAFGASFDLDMYTSQIGTMLYSSISAVYDAMGENALTVEDDGLRIASVYDFVAHTLNLNNVSADELQAVLQGLYSAPEGITTSSNNYRTSDFIVNSGISTADSSFVDKIDTDNVMTNQTASFSADDKELNGYINKLRGDTVVNPINSEQTIALARSVSSEPADKVRAWLNGYNGSDFNNADFLLFSMSVNTEDLLGSVGDGAGLIPSTMYATLVLEYDGVTDRFKDEASMLRLNSLTEAQMDILFAIAGFDPTAPDGGASDASFNTMTDSFAGVINDHMLNVKMNIVGGSAVTLTGKATFEAATAGNGIGKMKIDYAAEVAAPTL